MPTSTEPHFSVKICLANSCFGFVSTDSAIGFPSCLEMRKGESGPADSPTETFQDESPADAAIAIAQ
eukprot:8410411-Pyramimonas_sp.AAC.1